MCLYRQKKCIFDTQVYLTMVQAHFLKKYGFNFVHSKCDSRANGNSFFLSFYNQNRISICKSEKLRQKKISTRPIFNLLKMAFYMHDI